MAKIKIIFPDKSEKSFEKGVNGEELVKEAGEDIMNIVGLKFDLDIFGLQHPLEEDGTVNFITIDSDVGKDIIRHSTAHLMAHAVHLLFPDAKPTIGPTIEDGFYYDFDSEHRFTPSDLKKIEQKMDELAKKKIVIERKEISKEEAKKLFKDNPYKLELIKDLIDVRIYKQGDWFDLCRGPHVPHTGYIKAFKLTRISGAYWHGDARNKQLQRIYGIAFSRKEELKEYLRLREEAEKRDHRKIGRELDLFSIDEEAGPGFPFLHPNGSIIFNKLQELMRKECVKRGYKEIRTPQILKKDLWVMSGHWDHYRENMYFTKIDEADFAVKPMNCPGTLLVFKKYNISYRDMPFYLSEMGRVHRHELSGVLSGLFRVRCFTQDDAHIFCMPDQIEQEIGKLIDFMDCIYKIFGFDYKIELSTMPEKAIMEQKYGKIAEKALRNALNSRKIQFKVNEGEGAFYGPKIDFHIKDAIGRSWQCGTIQVDFSMPQKFSVTYMGEDGKKHTPVMIHRAIYGSLERFMGILIEHFAGKFPLWIAPAQAVIVTVADRFADYGLDVYNKLIDADVRVELDSRSESVSKKIREAQIRKIPLMLTVGEKEETNKTVAVRTLDGKVRFDVKVEELKKVIKKNIEKKSLSVEL